MLGWQHKEVLQDLGNCTQEVTSLSLSRNLKLATGVTLQFSVC
jgi:hypothetical protein